MAAGTSAGAAPILLVEDNPTTRKMFRIALESAGHRVIEAPDGRTALAVLARARPGLILQDLQLPDIDGFELARSMKERLGDRPPPIICVSGFLSRLDEAHAANGGFARVMVKPVDPLQLLEVVSSYLAEAPQPESRGRGRRVILVDDDPLHRKLGLLWLTSAGFQVTVAEDGAAALELARRERPDAIVTDVLMPRMDGFELCLAVRRDSQLADIAVVLCSSAYAEADDHALARRVGASALVSKSEGLESVLRAIEKALQAPRPPRPSESVRLLEEEHVKRALRQLERQVQDNVRLQQRTMLQEAQLAVLAGVAESLARNQVMNGVLGDVMAACLDMAGIAKGALYLAQSDGSLALKHQSGFSPDELAHLCAGTDCPELLADAAQRGKVTVIPGGETARRLVGDAGAGSLLLVPVAWASTTFGVMLLAARSGELSGEDALAFVRVLGAQLGQAIGLAQSFKRLSASELRYRTLTENANDAISILSPDGTIREVNRRLANILGRPADTIIGKRIAELTAPGANGDEGHVEVQRPDGSVALVEFSNTDIDVAGEHMVVAIGRDVTEQVRAQAQLMVSDRMASVGTLAAGVAHEINNPLAAVLANLDFAVEAAEELLAGAADAPPLGEVRDALRDARDAAERVRQIVLDLRIFSRAEESRPGALDVESVMDSSLRMAWNEIRHRARLVKKYGGVPRVEATESRLGQVFLNLVVNAAQAIPEGHAEQHRITIATLVDDSGRVIIEVQDTGAGIPPDVLKKLFTPFFTTKPAGVGTGLGLAICQRIVHGLGGEIAIDSVPGEGTTCRVVLPPSRIETEVQVEPAAVRAAARRGRVLLIDDDHMVASAVRRALVAEHDVATTTKGQEALDWIGLGERFDVILCDLMMPSMTGVELYEKLVAIAPDQAERVVFLTGGAFTMVARKFLDDSRNARMDKPFDVQTLRALINDRVR